MKVVMGVVVVVLVASVAATKLLASLRRNKGRKPADNSENYPLW